MKTPVKLTVFICCAMIPLFLSAQVRVKSGAKVTVHGGSKMDVAGDMTIDPEAELTLHGNMTVNGNMVNNGGTSAFIIASDASGTGSLIHSTANVNAMVERYLTQSQWHFIGIPVESATAEVFHLDGGHSNIYIRGHIESTNTWDDWIVSLETPLSLGRGYECWVADNVDQDETIVFDGILNAGDYTTGSGSFYALQYTSGKGLNLISNPYPTAIEADIDNWTKSNVANSVWIWNGTAGNYVYWNGTDGTNGSGWGTLTNGIIPAMQAFFVEATGSSPYLTIPQNSRTHNDQAYYKSSGKANTLELEIHGNGYEDAIFISFNEKATTDYEPDYDLRKIYGLPEAPQLYSIIPDEKLSINVLPKANESSTVQLGFECTKQGEFTIKANNLESFPESNKIYLEDLKEDVMHNLCIEPSYTFVNGKEEDPERFLLHFSYLLSELEENIFDKSDISIYSYGKVVYVRFSNKLADQEGNVFIYDMMGKEIGQQAIGPGELVKFNLTTNANHAIVKVVKGSAVKTEKVFIR